MSIKSSVIKIALIVFLYGIFVTFLNGMAKGISDYVINKELGMDVLKSVTKYDDKKNKIIIDGEKIYSSMEKFRNDSMIKIKIINIIIFSSKYMIQLLISFFVALKVLSFLRNI